MGQRLSLRRGVAPLSTIRGRLVLTYLLLVSFSLVVTGLVFLRWMELSLEQRAEAQLTSQSRVLGHFMSMYTQHEDDLPESARWVMKEFPHLTRARVRIADAGGNLLGDSLAPPRGRLDQQALRSPEGVSTWSEVGQGGRKIVHVTTPIRLEYPSPRTVGLVDVSSALSEIDDTFEELRSRLIVALAVALAASCLAAMLLAGTFTRPILEIRRTASRIAKGQLDERVTVSGAQELSELGQTINHMAAQLSERLGQLVSERDKVQTLLASLPDPIITLGAEKEITYLNPAAEAALQVERSAAEGRPLQELWPEERFQSQDAAAPEAFEVKLAPRTYRAYLLPYRDDEGRVGKLIVLRDMTDLRRLEEVRTLFLGSVSHELRTPLTIIKGFAATLLDLPETHEDLKKPLTRIDNEADRLTRLVNDLLDLTKIRSQKLSLELEPLVPEEVVEDAVELLRAHAERQGVELALRLEGELKLSPIPADRDRLKQVIINLVDNAVKFTPTGGQVTVRTRTRGQEWLLEVEDTGPGIPSEELPHLFDHFFRSREVRQVGGTGLGLAIVREIVEMHRGRVWAESEVGQGTRVCVALPAPREIRR